VLGRCRTSGVVRARKLCCTAQAGDDVVLAAGVDEDAARGRDELGGPPTFVATTGRPVARPSRIAWPKGSTRLGAQSTRAGRDPGRDLVVGDVPVIVIP
jgi:hypothetical protein